MRLSTYMKVFLGVSLLMLNTTMTSADVLILKNGNRFEGKIIDKTDNTIKFLFHGVTVTYRVDEIEAIEKEIPAVIVKDEEAKQKLKQKLIEEGKVDRIYEVNRIKTSNERAQETIYQQQGRIQELDAPGKPKGDVGIQFGSISDWAAEEQRRLDNMTPEERETYEKQKAAAERFYNER